MATAEEILALRKMIDDTTEPFKYSDAVLNAFLDDGETPNSIAARIWQEKAASYSRLVDVTESGSSRKLSDLNKHALEMAKFYRDQVDVETTTVRPTTRRIVRPTPEGA